MKYFKVKVEYGKGEQNSISIDENELEVALLAFLTEIKVLFKNGAVRGRDIISITEDWHKAMGWNQAHVLTDDDYAELKRKGVLKEYTGVIANAKERVQYLIRTNQTNLIGKNAKIPGLATPTTTQ